MARIVHILAAFSAAAGALAESGSPEPVTEDDFAALKESSPFTRMVGASDSLVMTGLARIGEDVFVTVVDTKTRQAQLISTNTNSEGWKLVSYGGSERDIKTMTAKIQLGAEVISIRYERLPPKTVSGHAGARHVRLDDRHAKEAKYAAHKYKEGFSSDGYPRQPPPDVVAKLSKLSTEQRESINREMIDLRNRGLGMEERRRIYNDKINHALRGGRR